MCPLETRPVSKQYQQRNACSWACCGKTTLNNSGISVYFFNRFPMKIEFNRCGSEIFIPQLFAMNPAAPDGAPPRRISVCTCIGKQCTAPPCLGEALRRGILLKFHGLMNFVVRLGTPVHARFSNAAFFDTPSHLCPGIMKSWSGRYLASWKVTQEMKNGIC